MKTTAKVAAICAALLLPTTAFAMSDVDCNAAWTKADANADGKLSGGEGTSYYASMQAAKKPVAADAMTKDMFMTNCKTDMFVPTAAAAKPDVGAPLAGANSFTETQAKDRATAAGYSSVSALKKDDSGIWRGTASKDSKTVNIAVDFKGNVVTN